MGIGLRLTESTKVNIGDDREELIASLTNDEIRYRVMYDKEDDDGRLQTIISINEFDLELSLTDNKVNYIRAYNCDNTSILPANYEVMSPAEYIGIVRKKISKLADDIMNLRIEVERLDMSSFRSAFTVSQDNIKIRIVLEKDAHGGVFMNTFKQLEIGGEAVGK